MGRQCGAVSQKEIVLDSHTHTHAVVEIPFDSNYQCIGIVAAAFLLSPHKNSQTRFIPITLYSYLLKKGCKMFPIPTHKGSSHLSYKIPTHGRKQVPRTNELRFSAKQTGVSSSQQNSYRQPVFGLSTISLSDEMFAKNFLSATIRSCCRHSFPGSNESTIPESVTIRHTRITFRQQTRNVQQTCAVQHVSPGRCEYTTMRY
jgi:hypothetical protein